MTMSPPMGASGREPMTPTMSLVLSMQHEFGHMDEIPSTEHLFIRARES